MNKTIKIGTGLLPTKKDIRDFSVEKTFGSIGINQIPNEFIIGETEILNQDSSDFCTAYATCAASSFQEGITLEPSWSFAVSKMISGDKNQWGQNLRDAIKSHIQYGAIEKSISPFNIENKSIEELRDINNWDKSLFEVAKKHKKLSFFRIDI